MSSALMVFGASSGIGQALLELAVRKGIRAIGVSRQARPLQLDPAVIWHQLDYQQPTQQRVADDQSLLPFPEEEIVNLCQQYQPQWLFICHGLLQHDQVKAEKSIRQLDITAASQSWWVNYLVPILHIKALWPYLLKHPCKLLVLSAKVGSISDNQLGGWYSYRSAKAALNMAVKTAAIELFRQQKNTQIVTVHPGTTDTVLAAPFSKNVPSGQLQSPDSTALRLWQVAEQLQPTDHGALLNWDGRQLPF
jgi:NAD(P)-dependent dehydrogenase (short-subunit alcohol dehydrogenase family)